MSKEEENIIVYKPSRLIEDICTALMDMDKEIQEIENPLDKDKPMTPNLSDIGNTIGIVIQMDIMDGKIQDDFKDFIGGLLHGKSVIDGAYE